MIPWRRRDKGIEESVNVEVPRVMNTHDGGCDYAMPLYLVLFESILTVGGRIQPI
jgi:hypothetical protein